MGGVSSSRLALDPEDGGASFEGRIRSEGGGFCGQRMRLLSQPIDLSTSDGMYLECAIPKASEDAIDPSRRVWKMAVRTKQDRGEVVYQQAFTPPAVGAGRQVVRLPFDGFRLVRGPRLVPGVPPLTPEQVNETYQVSIVVSKFCVSETGEALAGFEEGPFCLKLYSVGTYGTGASATPELSLPSALTEAEQRAAAPPLVKLLRPLLGLLFGENNRRRAAATKLLEARGSSRLAQAKLGWAWRCAAYGPFGALQRTATVALKVWTAALLALPIRLLFRTVVFVTRAAKRVKRLLTGGEPELKLPPLT